MKPALIALALLCGLTIAARQPVPLTCLDQHDDGVSLCHHLRAVR